MTAKKLNEIKKEIVSLEKKLGLYFGSEVSTDFSYHSYLDLVDYLDNLKDELAFQGNK